MSELYELPEGWEWKKLKDIFKMKSGDFLPKKKMIEGGKYNVYGGNGVNGNYNDFNLSGENIIIGRVGALCGNVRLVDGSIWITDNAFYISEYLINIDKTYLAIFLSYINLGKTANQAAQPVISNKGISSLNIPLPPLQEQKRIVAKLDTLFEKIDKAIALHKKNMDEADVFMGSVLNDVFGELGEKYQKDSLDNLTKLITKGTTPTTNGYKFLDKGINFLKIENIVNGEIDLSTIEMFISEEAHQSQKRSQLEVNDVLFSIAGTIGDTAIVKEEHLPMNTNQAVALIRPIDKLNPEFLRRLLSSSLSSQTTNKKRGGAIKNVSLGDIKNTIILLPPLNIQQKIVSYLDSISQKTEKLKAVQKKKMQSLIALKASILDQAFRGEL